MLKRRSSMWTFCPKLSLTFRRLRKSRLNHIVLVSDLTGTVPLGVSGVVTPFYLDDVHCRFSALTTRFLPYLNLRWGNVGLSNVLSFWQPTRRGGKRGPNPQVERTPRDWHKALDTLRVAHRDVRRNIIDLLSPRSLVERVLGLGRIKDVTEEGRVEWGTDRVR